MRAADWLRLGLEQKQWADKRLGELWGRFAQGILEWSVRLAARASRDLQIAFAARARLERVKDLAAELECDGRFQ